MRDPLNLRLLLLLSLRLLLLLSFFFEFDLPRAVLNRLVDLLDDFLFLFDDLVLPGCQLLLLWPRFTWLLPWNEDFSTDQNTSPYSAEHVPAYSHRFDCACYTPGRVLQPSCDTRYSGDSEPGDRQACFENSQSCRYTHHRDRLIRAGAWHSLL